METLMINGLVSKYYNVHLFGKDFHRIVCVPATSVVDAITQGEELQKENHAFEFLIEGIHDFGGAK